MCKNKLISWLIHRMQIWLTTRSAPGMSRMKSRLVRPRCFVLTMLPQRSLASRSIWPVKIRPLYTLLCSLMLPKGNRIYYCRESFFFFASFPFHLCGEIRRRKGIHDRRRSCFSLFITVQVRRS